MIRLLMLKSSFIAFAITLSGVCAFGQQPMPLDAQADKDKNSGGDSVEPFDINARFSGLIDLIHPHDADPILLQYYYGTYRIDADSSEAEQLDISVDCSPLRFDRIFHDPADPTSYLIIGRYSGSRKYFGLFRFHPEKPAESNSEYIWDVKRSLRDSVSIQNRNGHIVIASRNGSVYAWDGKELHQLHFEVSAYNPSPNRKIFRKMSMIESPAGEVCVYSITSDGFQKQLRDLIVWNGERFRRIELDRNPTGPPTFLDDQTMLMVTSYGSLKINIRTGEVAKQNISPPTSDLGSLKPVDIYRTPDGEILSLWRHTYNSYRPGDINAFEDGYYHQFARLVGERWEWIGVGRDLDLGAVTSAAVAEDGGLWFGCGGGQLLHRNPKGVWRRFGFEHGYHAMKPTWMKFLKGGGLWVHCGELDCLQRFDVSRFQSQPERVESNWKVFFSLNRPRKNANGYVDLITSDYTILAFGPKKSTRIPFPSREQFRFNDTPTICRDDDDRIWLFANIVLKNRRGPTAVYENNQWRIYTAPGNSENDSEITSAEVAFAELAQRGVSPGFTIGTSERTYYVRFGKKKQILYRNLAGRIAYYDGERWYSPKSGSEHPDILIDKFPFFHKGLITASNGDDKFIQIETDALIDADAKGVARPWREVEPIEIPKRTLAASPSRATPEELPIDEDSLDWNTGNVAGDSEWLLFANDSGTWVKIPTRRTPLIYQYYTPQETIDAAGRFIIFEKKVANFRVTVYEQTEFIAQQGDRFAGTLKNPFEPLDAKWRTLEESNIECRYRVDEGQWSNWLRPEDKFVLSAVRPPGAHKLTVELVNGESLSDRVSFEYEFEVTYDIDKIIEPMLKDLNSIDFQTRETATQSIMKFGPASIHSVEPLLKSNDAELVARARLIIDTLRPPQNSEDGEETDE